MSKVGGDHESKRTYLRDGRNPLPSSEAVSKVMSANKGKGTGPEVTLRRALWQRGIRGYRVNHRGLPGRPDLAFTKWHLAVMVHGCFWHRCPRCDLPLPRSNTDFWRAKFERNVARDLRDMEKLRSVGWRTMVVWECEIREDLGAVVDRIAEALKVEDEYGHEVIR